MPKRGKKYLEAAKLIERGRLYTPAEAVALVKKTAFADFDETIEAHFRLGIDPRQADQNVRSTVVLPHGTGKEPRVLVFAAGAEDLLPAATLLVQLMWLWLIWNLFAFHARPCLNAEPPATEVAGGS